MKLRLRSLESRDTTKLELPDGSSLHHLKQALTSRLVSSSSSSSSSVHFSLNRRDELGSSSPSDDLLQALGVTSGDLIYYSRNPNAFASPLQQQVIPIPAAPGSSAVREQLDPGESRGGESDTPSADLDPMAIDGAAEGENLGHQSVELEMNSVSGEGEGNEPTQFGEGREHPVLQGAESDADDLDGDFDKHSVPCFLRRVLREELGNDEVERRLVLIAVHAVMLESGFVGFNSVTGARVDGLQLPGQWPPAGFPISLSYTVPELLAGRSNDVESVVLKFRGVGHFLTVYGQGKSGLHRICLDEYRFAPTIDLMWANCDKDRGSSGDGSPGSYPENEVFEFWKVVKDGLALPLLIDLCEMANLPLPSCLKCLPTDLKLQILELLDVRDLVSMAFVSSEFKYLSSNDNVWKQKFQHDFPDVKEVPVGRNWKQLYVSYRNKNKRARTNFPVTTRFFRPYHLPLIWRDPDPLGNPRIIGGDHDWFPGLPPPLGRRPVFPSFHARRSVMPNCHLGGLNL